MDIQIIPARLSGAVTPPPSKSQAHRMIIAAALATGESRIRNVALSADIRATLGCMEQLGARWELTEGGILRVEGAGGTRIGAGKLLQMDCCESGSTLRFLIPIALTLGNGGVFIGRGRLLERPLTPYFPVFEQQGISCVTQGDQLTLQGKLTAGRFRLPGNVSSQFVTGLLYALPLLDTDSVLELTTPLESAGYVRMTLQALAGAGVTVEVLDGVCPAYRIPGGQCYQPIHAEVEADWSQAGFFFAAASLGNDLKVCGLPTESCQGDAVYRDFSAAMAGTEACVFDVSDCPDLVPPLAAQAALRADGAVTRLINAGRLRMKESDRLTAVTQVLNALGARVEEHPTELVIHGRDGLEGGVTVCSHNDHRIAMMTAVAATRCRRPVILTGAECVSKSYPDFWEVYSKLGGEGNVIQLR